MPVQVVLKKKRDHLMLVSNRSIALNIREQTDGVDWPPFIVRRFGPTVNWSPRQSNPGSDSGVCRWPVLFQRQQGKCGPRAEIWNTYIRWSRI
jgi:hypothetical protein